VERTAVGIERKIPDIGKSRPETGAGRPTKSGRSPEAVSNLDCTIDPAEVKLKAAPFLFFASPISIGVQGIGDG
jgi:hypothetical protein